MSTRFSDPKAEQRVIPSDKAWMLEPKSKTASTLLRQVPGIVPQSAWVSEALRLAYELDVTHLAVADVLGKPLGVLCLCDLEQQPQDTEVARRMSTPAVTVDSSTPADQAAQQMKKRKMGCLPVLEEGSVIGLLTRGDFIREGLFNESEYPRCAVCLGYHHVRANAPEGTLLCSRCQRWNQRQENEPAVDIDIWCTD
jgi:signal-transduction protein with cAMP-binding, CBS, and nucleotidyltransferase domain